jgi:hypothetical protein
MRMMGAESVAYHRATVLERGDDFPGRALAYYASRGETLGLTRFDGHPPWAVLAWRGCLDVSIGGDEQAPSSVFQPGVQG